LLSGQRVLASLPKMGRRQRAVFVEPFAEPTAVPEARVARAQPMQPKLSQPKVAHDPILDWASGE
jgi:hypothetical protein